MNASSQGEPRSRRRLRGPDLVHLPLLGPFLRWRHARLAVQIPMALLALVLVLHGLLGPQLAPKNLATLLVWVHWRGVLVFGLLLVGNVFCFGCPLLLPREVARRLRRPTRRLPRFLRNKWPGLGLLVAVLFVYEWLDLWASPQATAIAILAYFALALVVDAAFRDAPFCKWICPIGQFNFVASTLSPFEVRVRDRSICDACETKDCIRGRREPVEPASSAASEPSQAIESSAARARPAGAERVVQRGCELALFLPRKVGNLDCTFCLDCVHACPSDNVAIAPRLPGDELALDPPRSGFGRLSRRRDVAALSVVFTFGALLNAFGMVRPVYALQESIADGLGTRSEGVVLAILFVACLVVLPALLLGAVGLAVRALTGARPLEHLVRFAPALLPIGFGVWLAHYGFHFLTGLWTFVPVTQHSLLDLGIDALGRPSWGLGGLTEAQVWPIEQGLLALGLVGSLAVSQRLARREFPRRVARAFAPWAALHLTLAALALWLLAQPMEMRGTFL